jgi:hypothetical protein
MPSVSGASSGNGTGELARPGASPQPPATGGQTGAVTTGSGQAVGGSPVTSVPNASETHLPSGVPARADPDETGTAPVAGRVVDSRSDDNDRLRGVQFVLGLASVFALLIALFVGLRRRGRRSHS